MSHDNEIERIMNQIGSSYGEGATYTTDNDISHLHSTDKELFISDLKKLVVQAKIEILEDILQKEQECIPVNYAVDKPRNAVPSNLIHLRVDQLKKELF